MALSKVILQEMQRKARSRCVEWNLDPDAPHPVTGEPHWKYLCKDVIGMDGYKSSKEIPEEHGKWYVLFVERWAPTEFVDGAPHLEKKNDTEA